MASSEIDTVDCELGGLSLQQVSPEKCHVRGNGLEVAKLGERATAVLHVVDD